MTTELLVQCAERLGAHLSQLDALARADGSLNGPREGEAEEGAADEGGESACAARLPTPLRRLLFRLRFFLRAAARVPGGDGGGESLPFTRSRSDSDAAGGSSGGGGSFEISVLGSSAANRGLLSGARV